MRRREPQRLLLVLLLSHQIEGFGPHLHLLNTRIPLQSQRSGKSKVRASRQPSRNGDENRGFGNKGGSSRSKVRAISALSQPKANEENKKNQNTKDSILPPPSDIGSKKSRKQHKLAHMKRRKGVKNRDMPSSFSERNGRGERDGKGADDTYSSLLPPPLKDTIVGVDDEELSPGLSSWDDFLSGSSSDSTAKTQSKKTTAGEKPKEANGLKENAGGNSNTTQQLPSIDDLFPQPLTATNNEPKAEKKLEKAQNKKSLDGVLPVSDLFFRACRKSPDEKSPVEKQAVVPVSFSESSSSTDAGIAEMAKTPSGKKKTGRKMVRRGMEMLVGGRPVNADPPLRCLEISYNPTAKDWASTVLLNTREFGPLLHVDSVHQVSKIERGLFCEYFVNSALKWDVCPSDLKQIVKDHAVRKELSRGGQSGVPLAERDRASGVVGDSRVKQFDSEPPLNGKIRTHDEEDEADGMLTIQVRTRRGSADESSESFDVNDLEIDGSGSASWGSSRGSKSASSASNELQQIVSYEFGGAIFEFDVGLSVEDLQSGDPDYEVLKAVLTSGVMMALKEELYGFDIEISHFVADPIEDERTSVSAEFNMKCVEMERPVDYDDIEKKAVKVMAAFAEAIEGDLGLALAEVAQQEHRWTKRVREKFVEECLDTEEEDETEKDGEFENIAEGLSWQKKEFSLFDGHDGPFGKRLLYSKDDLYLGNGNEGVFYDHSERNIHKAPYSGQLGLRLVDAVVERAKQRQPRVIAVGDVHGCIDELQDLLRQCNYRPGDLVVFLGDLVCKGPDSTSVVQMAREIGAIGVRGNHDFEVIRWHQAIKSGVEPPVVGSEHYHVASCLSKADIKWMYSLPWFMSSKDLGALFVHAGFVSGVRLAKQNPRLMMNMRSILPDGTVTSKFFNNWPWARLWDGPQTVLFGHDADRGLQQYEHAIGLDTGCVYGGRLTACILPERRLVSVSARREYFKYRRKKYD
eukprot:scaffold34646_cov173-Amphora_coffeaeformis.AAC.27